MEEITLSIFVPCFNEEKNIIKALNCIKQGVHNISYEVLVVDDASKDKTVEMVGGPARLRLPRDKSRG